MTTTTDLDRATRLRMYRTMVECRFFEVRAQELFFEGLVRGTTHLGVGQEAVAAGVAAAMREDDYTFCTYRGHNHTLARGVPMAPIFAELFGRGTGLLGGKGGSMHLTSVEHGAMGSYAIVGAHLPIALGRGLVGAVPEVGPGRGLLLRRRDDQHRGVPRGPQHGRGLEGAGRVRVREQPVHGVHADRRRDRRGASGRGPGVGLRPRVDHRRRQRRGGGPRGGPGSDRPSPRRRRPVAHRGPHLSARRPLARRPRQVPAGRRGRRLEGTRPDPGLPGDPRGERPGGRRRSTPSTPRRTPPSPTPRRSRAPRPSRPRTSSRPRSGPTEARRGGTDLPSRIRRGDRAGDGPRPDAWCSSARTSGQPEACSS